jgi:hypothetical protein
MRRILTRLAGATLLPFLAGSASGEAGLSPSATLSGRAPSAMRPRIGEACKNEFFALCKDLPTNSRRAAIVDCLRSHPESLSRDCVEAMADKDQQQTRVAQPARGAHRGRRRGEGGFGDGSTSAATHP